MTDRRLVGILCVLGGVLAFSSSSSLVKWSATDGAAIAFWRLLLSAVLWWVVLGVRRVRTGTPVPAAATWKLMVPVALCFGLNITVFFSAIPHTSIAHAEFITALSPLVLVPAGALLFGERPDTRALLWGAVTVVGLAIVLFAGGDQGGATVGGDLLILVVVAFWAGYLITARRARATVDLVDFMATVMNLAFLFAAPVTLLLAWNEIGHMTARGWLVAGILSVLTGMVAHGLIAAAQRDVDVGTISILQVSQPAVAVAWAYVILGESVLWVQVPGMILVILGLVAFTIVSQRRGAVSIAPRDLVPVGAQRLSADEPCHGS
jgi:drug/metabolite transporter (DMT)-like permease